MATGTIFETEPNNTIPTGSASGLTSGVEGLVRMIGTLPTPAPVTVGDFDYYRVDVLNGQYITARVNSLSGLDASLDILDSSGAVVATAATAGDDETLAYTVATSGAYYIRVSSNGSVAGDPFNASSPNTPGATTGSYQLFLNTDRVADTVTGSLTPNLLVGVSGAGAEAIAGGASDDVIEGNDGVDTLAGDAGEDLFIWRTGDGADLVDGGAGTDTVQALLSAATTIQTTGGLLDIGGATYTSVEQVGVVMTAATTLTINDISGLGINSLTGANAASSIVILGGRYLDPTAVGPISDNIQGGAANVQLLVATGNGGDNIVGGNANDQLDGGAGGDFISGGAGNDVIVGGAGSDNMVGGLGNDIYVVDVAGDFITENVGEGIDTVYYSTNGTYTTFANVENNVLQAGGTLTGAGTDDVLLAQGTAAATLNGLAGRDFLQGGGGNDILTGGLGDDYMIGGAGVDTYVNQGIFGVDVIADFTAGAGGDIVRLDAYQTFSQVQSRLFQVDADGDGGVDDAYLIVDSVNTISFLNVQTTALTQSNFTFA